MSEWTYKLNQKFSTIFLSKLTLAPATTVSSASAVAFVAGEVSDTVSPGELVFLLDLLISNWRGVWGVSLVYLELVVLALLLWLEVFAAHTSLAGPSLRDGGVVSTVGTVLLFSWQAQRLSSLLLASLRELPHFKHLRDKECIIKKWGKIDRLHNVVVIYLAHPFFRNLLPLDFSSFLACRLNQFDLWHTSSKLNFLPFFSLEFELSSAPFVGEFCNTKDFRYKIILVQTNSEFCHKTQHEQ